jgi:hypothetical protein
MRVARHLRPFWLALILVATLTVPDPGARLLLPEGLAELTQPKLAYAVPFIEQENIRDPARAAQFRGIHSPTGLSVDGRVIAVTGHINCTPELPGEVATIQVVISQPVIGAVGLGQTQAACTGAQNRWVAQLLAVGPATFLPGQAQACAVATGYTLTRRIQWCRDGGTTLVSISSLLGLPPVLPMPVPVAVPLPPPMTMPLLPFPGSAGEPLAMPPTELAPRPAGMPTLPILPAPLPMPAGAAPAQGD